MTNEKRIPGIIFIAAILSCFAAFINKYPLIYPDTGTYIASGFSGKVPIDRPIFYGLFLRHSSLSASLWFTLFAQSLLLSQMLYTTLGIFFSGLKRSILFLLLIALLVLFTSYSYTVSLLIPDMFTSLSLLCFMNLLLNKNLSGAQKWMIGILMLFSLCTHFSNIIILLLLIIILALHLLIRKIKKRNSFVAVRKLMFTGAIVLGSMLIVPSVHFMCSGRFVISNGSHVFLMNHLHETGVLGDYLVLNCDKKNYRICEYKNNLGWDFMWGADSPLNKMGGWDVNSEEYWKIIKDVYTTPRHLEMLIFKSWECAIKQLFSFDTNVCPPQLGSSNSVFAQISWEFKDSLHEYLGSRQSNGAIDTSFINEIQRVLVLIGLVFLFLILAAKSLRSRLDSNLKWMALLVLVFSVLNAAVCSNLATIESRYQNRIMWLIPFVSVIAIIKLNEDFSSKKN